MARIFLPPRVARELLEERHQFAGAVERGTYTDRVCEDWTRELRKLDPRLRMRRAYEYYVIGTPLLPGHYHYVRDNEGAPPTVQPITGPDGEWCEPDGSVLEKLKRSDLQNTRVTRDLEAGRLRVELEQEREKERIRAERQDELLQRWQAASRTQVSMNRDTPWHQNAAGKRGARRPD